MLTSSCRRWFRVAVVAIAGHGWAIVRAAPAADAALTLAEQGRTAYVIALAADAAAPERSAARELAAHLGQVTGAEFAVVSPSAAGDRPVVAVGPGAAAAILPGVDLSLGALGHEGILLRTSGRHLALTGAQGARRGTLYAVYAFLEDVVGCRWWAPGAATIPARATLTVPAMDRQERPAFEYREAYIAHTVDGPWAARNRVNGYFYPIPEDLGGHILYYASPGRFSFVHTFDTMVPPKEFFPQHPEWFSEIGGKRVGPPERSQWCLTNAALLEHVKARARELLRQAPPDAIVEISQNDWGSRCQCPACVALEKEEGSPAGPLLRLVNAVAEAIEQDFPDAVVSTLAYQYTRQPPRLTRPRPNVCIRLCSIEGSFLQPLEHDANRAFAADLRRWSELTDRLYVWDYVTNFSLPLQPHPNLRVLAPNLRFLAANGVRGVFEEGGHYTLGAAFSEIRAWVLAKLLWNPHLDGEALVREFVQGYYGPAAAPVQRYIDRLHDTAEATGHYLTCFDQKSPFLTVALLTEAEGLLAQAEAAVADQPDLRQRVEILHASVWHGIVSRWPWLEQRRRITGQAEWFSRSRADYCADYVRVCREHRVNPKHIARWESVQQRRQPAPPELVRDVPLARWVDLQDEGFALYHPGEWAALVDDEAASDGAAARMPATHLQWATQCTPPLDAAASARPWAVYVAVRVDRAGQGDGTAFTAGIYDTKAARSLGHLSVSLADAAPDGQYRLYRIPEARLSPDCYIWVAPAKNPELVQAVWVDRMILIDEGP